MTKKPILTRRELFVHYVQYHELERFVREVYGVKQFVIAANEECGNDTTLEFLGVDGTFDTHDAERFSKWKAKDGIGMYSTGAVMRQLCRDGHIQAGNWMIRVSW